LVDDTKKLLEGHGKPWTYRNGTVEGVSDITDTTVNETKCKDTSEGSIKRSCQSLGNTWSTAIFGGPIFIVTLANWHQIVKPAFFNSHNIRNTVTVILKKQALVIFERI
jgi:hypothetical protein